MDKIITTLPPLKVSSEFAINLCCEMYKKLSPLGYYPALTGGLLYKEGRRKDIDIVIFRNRQSHLFFEMRDIERALSDIGFTDFIYYGFVTKSRYKGVVVDLMNPEAVNDDVIYGESHRDDVDDICSGRPLLPRI